MVSNAPHSVKRTYHIVQKLVKHTVFRQHARACVLTKRFCVSFPNGWHGDHARLQHRACTCAHVWSARELSGVAISISVIAWPVFLWRDGWPTVKI